MHRADDKQAKRRIVHLDEQVAGAAAAVVDQRLAGRLDGLVAELERTANLAMKAGVEGSPFKIESPLVHMNKVDIIKLASRLGGGQRQVTTGAKTGPVAVAENRPAGNR